MQQSSPHQLRALVLLEQGRPDLAEPELRRALADDPHDGYLHALLGLCLARLERKDEALKEAREAVGLEPDFPFSHYALARVLLLQDRPAEAEAAIREALDLDPEEPDYHAVRAASFLARRRWQEALAAADAGLAADPEHADLVNLRSTALVQLGRRDEAVHALGGALARDPEDARAHANQGWALLHRGEPRRALEHFREALRLEPNSAWARAGLVEAMKARNPLYAALLRYFLWMSRLDRRTQWMVILGGLFGYRFLRAGAESTPALQPLVVPLMVVYLSFVLLSWTAEQLFNLVLLLDPLGRHALTRDQRVWSGLLGTALLVALGFVALALFADFPEALFGAMLFGGLLIPIAGTSRASGKARVAMAVLTGALASLAVGSVALAGTSPEASGTMFGLCLLGIVASSWIGTFLSMRG
ncbi:MAG TPA: tetratricopeptide repeat protein [Longimicrobium sp.]|nr:tetratricopeptide repeat protein [Longimicrobium sp.]